MTDASNRAPRYAYEDPAALAWAAQLLRTAHRRRLLRLAAEAAQHDQQRTGAVTAPGPASEPDDAEAS